MHALLAVLLGYWLCANGGNGHTSMMTGTTRLLSVIRVTTVSVKVLFVMVSVTRPGPVGAGGSSIGGSGRFIVTDTVCVGSGVLEDALVVVVLEEVRKWAGIMA